MNTVLSALPVSPLYLMIGLVALASLFAMGGIISILGAQDRSTARLRGLKQRGRNATRARLQAHDHKHKAQAMDFMRDFVQKMRLLGTEQADQASKALMAAGQRGKDALVMFLFAKVFCPMIFGGAAIFNVYVLYEGNLQPIYRLLIALTAVVVGTFLPNFVVRNLGKKRQKALRKGLPDALDLLVICAEAGLSLDAALSRVAREMHNACPELSEELQLTSNELGLLPERRKALLNLSERTGLDHIRGVVNTLLQTERYGTPLSQSLRVLSAEFRTERMMKAEEKAAKLPATLTLPLILFILPTLFIVLIGPGILKAIDSFSQL